MPIFHDPDLLLSQNKRKGHTVPEHQPPPSVMRKPSEESIRTEFCDGPEPDPPTWIKALEDKAESINAREEENQTSNRAELIERIKRGETTKWVPSPALEQEYLKENSRRSPSPPRNLKHTRAPTRFLPPAEISPSDEESQGPPQACLSPPGEIQRPKSALHTGNFTEGSEDPRLKLDIPLKNLNQSDGLSKGPLGTSPTTPWFSPPLKWPLPDTSKESQDNERDPTWIPRRPARSRAPSLHSYSSSYVLKAPTTPLVQQSNTADLDFPAVSPIDLSEIPVKENRRHTLPTHALSDLPTNDFSFSSSVFQPLSDRLEGRPPHQQHGPRRSLTSTWSLQMATTPQSPKQLGSRRQSLSSESASLHRASMVGSYEESILRGRMSTAPSKPLEFTAHIGVLGKDNCKPKCPAHVTVPFPAVFYSYSSSGSNSDVATEPSPYVGHIDLEHLLPPAEPDRDSRKRRVSPNLQNRTGSHPESAGHQDKHDDAEGSLQVRKRKKRRQASLEPEIPPGGSYRIPQKGQLQIIIKNPNKTAVKLFLVPYDLTGMDSGTKTFIRQRCYCSGTSVEKALSSNPGEATQTSTFTELKKPPLRYLIHINICSPSKGRFYLYHQLRVVFANRVPDNKEQLLNDIQLPDPRFSAYKPTRESLTSKPSLGDQLTADKAFRRRSAGFGSEPGAASTRYSLSMNGGYPFGTATPTPPVPPIPFDLAMPRPRPMPEVSDGETSRPTTASDAQSPLSDRQGRIRATGFGSFQSISSSGSDSYTKLSKGDTSNGGIYGRPSTPEPGEGLLARRLRGLGLPKGPGSEEDR